MKQEQREMQTQTVRQTDKQNKFKDLKVTFKAKNKRKNDDKKNK